MENEKDITKEEFKETAGMQFARAVKPAGCILLLLILLGVDSFLTDAFKGAIVVAAVLMQRKERS